MDDYGELCGSLQEHGQRCMGVRTNPFIRHGEVKRWLCNLCQRYELRGQASANRKRTRGKVTERMILIVLGRQRERCAICGCSLRRDIGGFNFHLDHIQPVSKGGVNSLANFQALCPPCNLSKKDKWAGVSKEERRRLALKAVQARELKRKVKKDSAKQAD